jgi:hypothetical protein
MVNENHFRFDRKNFFNFWKTIYGFKNRKSFSEIKLFIIVRTFDIRLLESGNGRSLESKRRRNPTTSGYRSTAGGSDSDRNWPKSDHSQKPARSGQNGRNPSGSDRIRRSSAEIRPNILVTVAFSLFVIFSCEPNARKSFFLKMISLKIFYIETNGA